MVPLAEMCMVVTTSTSGSTALPAPISDMRIWPRAAAAALRTFKRAGSLAGAWAFTRFAWFAGVWAYAAIFPYAKVNVRAIAEIGRIRVFLGISGVLWS